MKRAANAAGMLKAHPFFLFLSDEMNHKKTLSQPQSVRADKRGCIQ
jgi:hypothetical protein